MNNQIKLTDNASLKGREEQFTLLEVHLDKIVLEWQKSLFSFEWLTPDGQVKDLDALGETQAQQYKDVKSAYNQDKPLERPILGLGTMDNVEIGSKKEVLLTLYELGVSKLGVHVPKSCLEDFEKFM